MKAAEMEIAVGAPLGPAELAKTARHGRNLDEIARSLMRLECARSAVDEEIARLRHIQAQRTS